LGKRVGNGLKDNGENFHELNLKSPPMRWIGETLKAMRTFETLTFLACSRDLRLSSNLGVWGLIYNV
jgi:hypothetical protein